MDYINIPVELCKYALTKHKVRQLRLYVFLKSKCSGHMKLSKQRIKEYCKELGYKTPKTFKTHLSWLLKHKWVSVNNKTGNYRIRSFAGLGHKLRFSSVKGAIFEPLDFSRFKSFVIAAVITYYMKQKSRYDRRSELKIRSSRKNRLKPAFFSLPHLYLAKVLKISKSSAAKYRENAEESGYIVANSCYRKIDIPLNEVKHYKRHWDSRNNLRVMDNKLVEQLNDKLTSNVVLRTKRELKFMRKNVHR